ncbi:MAG: anaerobic sulfatase-maturation protein [Syntrophales bacterium]|jgi:uncharacterized protein|nr:anaerobic sulfatase-maturation protein [Syntrophales bacterium]
MAKTDNTKGATLAQSPLQGFHILVKPIGPLCNLNCGYCFYKEKKALFAENETYRMSERVLEAFVEKYIRFNAADMPEIPFAWQGGEPMLMGLDFFRKAVKLQKRYSRGKRITNALQTNGVLLDEAWCEFLAENHFLVGLSLDGPEDIHDRYRVDEKGKGSFSSVMKGLELLRSHGVEYNVMAGVTRESACRPLDVYHFFKKQGVEFIQFIPIVERLPDDAARALGLRLAPPPDLGAENPADVTPWTVEPERYGDFLIGIFDEWVRNDVGKIFIMNFEWALMSWMGGRATVCQFSRHCGRSAVMEHNGDLYACDHYVYPRYRLGNILSSNPREMVDSPQQRALGSQKETALPTLCRDCKFLFACRGECPKHRFLKTPANEPGLNYLCAGYKKYFQHIDNMMKLMKQLLEAKLSASYIMDALRGPLAIRLRSTQ